ncbi:hypothetical protein EPO44_02795 [bacterium]|nr:MAG: hypothetical protein EPO44_02795 [bacterium]
MGAKAKFSEGWCYETLREARWPNGTICPYCGQGRVTTHTRFTNTPRHRYLCLDCRRTFSDLTGTPFARTNLPLSTWFFCLQLSGQGLRTSELARELRVKWDTLLYMQRRLTLPLNRPGLIRRLREAAQEIQSE